MDLVLGLEIIKQMLACFPPQACQAAALMSFDKAQGLQMAPGAVTSSLFLLSRLLLLSNTLDHGARLLSQELVGQPLDAEEDMLIIAQQGHMFPSCTSQITILFCCQ